MDANRWPVDIDVTIPAEAPARRRWLRPRLPAWLTRRRAAAIAAVLVLLAVLAPGVFIGVECFRTGGRASPSPEVPAAAADVKGYARSESATYLTLPAWYVVYSADAYAAFIREHPPSRFPYFRSIGQYWSAYRHVCRVTKRAYPFEAGTHLGLGVTGVGFSVEQALRGAYEATLGRLTEWVASHDTEEDAFAYLTAQAYGAFRHTTPWYEFPFGRTLAALWRTTRLRGPHPVRKWERKLVLSAEYGLKGLFALVVRTGARAVGDPADRRVHAHIESAPDAIFADSTVSRVKALSPRSYIVSLPPDEAFTVTTMRLVARGVRFLDIAGNDEMLVTAIVPGGFRDAPVHGTLVFDAPLLEDASRRRVALKLPVRDLHAILPALERRGARIEHLYDY